MTPHVRQFEAIDADGVGTWAHVLGLGGFAGYGNRKQESIETRTGTGAGAGAGAVCASSAKVIC